MCYKLVRERSESERKLGDLTFAPYYFYKLLDDNGKAVPNICQVIITLDVDKALVPRVELFEKVVVEDNGKKDVVTRKLMVLACKDLNFIAERMVESEESSYAQQTK